jgi:hypothetical protein
MKKVLLASVLAASILVAIPAAAQTADGSFFVGGDIGHAKLDESGLDSGNLFAVNGGYRWQIAPAFKAGVEGGYVQLGDFDADWAGGKAKMKGWTLGGNLHYNFTPNWYASARLGAFFADLSFSSRYGSYSDDRTGSYGGVGFGYDFSNNASVGLNYTHFRVAGSDVNALSVNGEWRF